MMIETCVSYTSKHW